MQNMMQQKRILIVEDEALAGLLLEDALQGAGYEVIGPARTAAEALALAGPGGVDLALVDIRLQGANEGIEAARGLAALGVPVLFTTGQGQEAARHGDVALGLLQKPYAGPDAVAAVAAALIVAAGGALSQRPAYLELFER
jgi:two-component system, response regulator PdtaR